VKKVSMLIVLPLPPHHISRIEGLLEAGEQVIMPSNEEREYASVS